MLAKLRELGWEEELDILEQSKSDYAFLTEMRCVGQERPLTAAGECRKRSYLLTKSSCDCCTKHSLELRKTPGH